MRSNFVALLCSAALAGTAVAKHCVNMTIPVTVSAETIKLNLPVPKDKFDSIAFLEETTSRTANPAKFVTGKTMTSGTYDISAKYCTPDTAVVGGKDRSKTVQFLIHGLGFDKTYWDFSLFNYNYSYTNEALKAGYSTFAIDRLGVGESSKPDPVIVQLSLENAIVTKLTELLRSGSCKGIPAKSKVIHVGHSYGSVLSNTLVTKNPKLSDAVILTGFSHNAAYQPISSGAWLTQPAAWNQPKRFGTEISYDCHGKPITPLNLPLGYITWNNVLSNMYTFFALAMFDKVVLQYAEATKWPFTSGESFTLNGFMTTNFSAPEYKGPVLIATGELDKIYCNSDCHGILEPSAAKFPKASKFQTYLQPGTGHALNLHYNSTGLYKTIMTFLDNNGL